MYIYMQPEFYIFPQTGSSNGPERKIVKKYTDQIPLHKRESDQFIFLQFDVAACRSHPYFKSSSTGQWSDPNTSVRIFASSSLFSSAFDVQK